jgi:membrane associated rhomboid family serine protease
VIPLKDDLPTERAPLVTYALIAANLAAFAWQLSVGIDLSVQRGGSIPYEILTFRDIEWRDIVPPPFTLLTSMFLHGGFAHVGLNMLTLWIFGNNVEDALGRLRYLAFYLLCGIAAGLTQTLASAATGDVLVPMVGASGAIAGVLAAYLVLFPGARVLTLLPILILVHLPARLFILGWFGLQVLSVLLGGAPGGGVAVFAHIGGFVAGLVLVRLLGRRPTWRERRVSF